MCNGKMLSKGCGIRIVKRHGWSYGRLAEPADRDAGWIVLAGAALWEADLINWFNPALCREGCDSGLNICANSHYI